MRPALSFFINKGIMNIFELTRILKEAEQNSNKAKSIIDNIKALENMAEKSDGQTSGEIQEFLDNINGQIEVKYTELGGDEDSNKNLKILIDRMQRFNIKSNPNVWVVIRHLLASLSNDDLQQILSIADKNKNITNELMSGGIGGLVGGLKRKASAKRIRNFFERLAKLRPGTCGPYELLLCTIFDGYKFEGTKGTKDMAISLNDKANPKGDIIVNGVVYEVKKVGDGVIDAGISNIKNGMVGKRGDELKQMRKALKVANGIFERDSREGYKLANEYAKNLSKQKKSKIENQFHDAEVDVTDDGIRSDVVDDYFSLLSDDEKKIATIYGFSKLGYNNIIVVGTDVDMKTKVLSEKDIANIINGDISILTGLGLDIVFKNNSSPTATFGSVAFKFI